METATQNPTMAMEDFRRSQQFLALTQKQQTWVESFLESQNASLATRVAYGATDDAYVAMFTRKLETSPRIIAALDLFYGRSQKDAFLSQLERTIQSEKGPAKVAAMQLMARLKFNEKSETPVEPSKESKRTSDAPEAKFKVGDPCQVDGMPCRVIAVNESGRPTDVEPL